MTKEKGKIGNLSFSFDFLLLPCLSLCLCFSVVDLQAQTGGSYDLSHNNIASGGGSASVGGSFSLDGTVGQGFAGTLSSGGGFSVQSGFWSFGQLAPTSALVPVSGRVTDSHGRGIGNAILWLTAPDGSAATSQTGSFGFFRFENVEAGQTYILEVRSRSRRFTFAEPIRVIFVADEISDIVFVAEPD